MTHCKKIWDYHITRKNICMHVTALKGFMQFLLIAEGNQATLYNLSSKKVVGTEIVFTSSSIHGIRSDDNYKFLFFGSKSLRAYIYHPTSPNYFKSITTEIFLSDWILDSQWISNCNKLLDCIAVVLAHNTVVILDIKSAAILENVQCSENCILYSASILSSFEDNLVIAVGTVFQQILLWSPNSVPESKVKLPLHRLEGHQGVIFSICYNKFYSLLSSTSDDRSIRLWKINSTAPSQDSSILEYWEKANITPSHILYAHESRVWTSVILNDCIISVGEDSTICFWSIDGNLLRKQKCHKNGSIWCLETSSCDQELTELCGNVAFTGGSDGGVYCWNLQSLLSNNCLSQISLHNGSSKQDFSRTVSILQSKNTTKLMTTTNQGWLSFYDMTACTWKNINQDASFESYCISSVSSKGHIALGNLTGDLALLSYNEDVFTQSGVEKFNIYDSKIMSLHWVNLEGECLVSCGANGHLILWKVSYNNSEYKIKTSHELQLPKGKPHWWSTCAAVINSTKNFIVGDRTGSICFYALTDICNQRIHPSTTYKYIHGENGVTDIQEYNSLVYSAGRDGQVLLYAIEELSLTFLHAIKISHQLEWIGKIIFYNSDMLLLGFHTKYFVLWSTELESTVMTVDCGGGHRSWDFNLKENGEATFAAIKKKDIIFATEDLNFTLNNSIIKVGTSGREFCQTCYLFTTEYKSSECMSVFAAGGEDNALQIVGIINDGSVNSKMLHLYNLAGHLSSIRALAKSSMYEENAFLLASVGGRAQIILWKIKIAPKIMCQQLFSSILFSFEKKSKRPWKENQTIQMNPQTRLMDVLLNKNSRSEKESYTVALGCSDSYFRVYTFDVKEKNLNLMFAVQPTEHCILRISCIQNTQALENYILYLMSSTDGNLSFVNHHDSTAETGSKDLGERLGNVAHQIKLHQSGINALDVKHLFDRTWLISTAGDDNSISVLAVEINSDLMATRCIKFLKKAEVLSAHASQITGLRILDSEIIVSVSIDQRINLWKWSLKPDSLSITFLSSKVSLIPDIANIECWKNEKLWKIIVCGEGMEIFSVENTYSI